MQSLHTAIRVVLIGYLSVLLLAAGLVVCEWKLHHVRLLSVQTNSMVPVFHSGDALLVRPVSEQALHTRQIITYTSPADDRVLVSHRLVSVDRQTGLLTTKGDNATRRDIPFSPTMLVGQVSFIVPRFGYVIDILHSRIGLIAGVYVPALIVVAGEIRHLAQSYGYGRYRLPSYRKRRFGV